MKLFQYITINSKGQPEEIWVCEDCRKKNSIQILKGKWRLIDKRESADFGCDKCPAVKTETDQRVHSDNGEECKSPFL